MLTERTHYYNNKMRFFRIFLSLNLFDTPFPLITKLIGSYLTSSNIDSVTEKRDFMQLFCLYLFVCTSERHDGRKFSPFFSFLHSHFQKYSNSLLWPQIARPQTRTQSLFILRRGPQPNPQSSLIPKKHLNSDWVRVWPGLMMSKTTSKRES